MEHQVKVSIICNTYNHEKYIRDALEGFVMQKTTFPFEVLVHDDASTDHTADIIREYEEKYPDIIKPIYQTENQYSKKVGINKTFQKPRVKGKYVAFCEGDDYWIDSLKLQKQYDFMETHEDYSLCACSVIWLNMQTGKKTSLCQTAEDRDISAEEIILEKKGRIFQTASIFMKSAFWIHSPEWTAKFPVGDYPLEIHAATLGKVHMLADTMAVYRNCAEGSWTARIGKDAEYKTRMFYGLIEGLYAFNSATNFRYDAVVSRRINQIKYNIARTNRELKTLLSKELREIYKSRRFLSRVSDVLYCINPRLHAFIMRKLAR